MRINELMKMMKGLSSYQKDRIQTIMVDFVRLNNFCVTNTPTVCLNCGKKIIALLKRDLQTKSNVINVKSAERNFYMIKYSLLTIHNKLLIFGQN